MPTILNNHDDDDADKKAARLATHKPSLGLANRLVRLVVKLLLDVNNDSALRGEACATFKGRALAVTNVARALSERYGAQSFQNAGTLEGNANRNKLRVYERIYAKKNVSLKEAKKGEKK